MVQPYVTNPAFLAPTFVFLNPNLATSIFWWFLPDLAFLFAEVESQEKKLPVARRIKRNTTGCNSRGETLPLNGCQVIEAGAQSMSKPMSLLSISSTCVTIQWTSLQPWGSLRHKVFWILLMWKTYPAFAGGRGGFRNQSPQPAG